MELIDTTRKLVGSIMLALFMSASAASAQSEPAVSPLANQIQDALAESLTKASTVALRRYFPESDFRIEAAVTIATMPRRMPYLSDAAYLRMLEKMSVDAVAPLISSTSIRIYLSKRIGQNSADEIRQVLQRALKIKSLNVTFAPLTLEYNPADNEATQEILKLDARLLDAEREAAAMTRERDDIKQEAIDFKVEVEKLTIKNRDLTEQVEAHKGSANSNGNVLDMRSIVTGAGALSLALLISAAMFIGARGLASSHRLIADGLKSIGQSLMQSGSSSDAAESASISATALDGQATAGGELGIDNAHQRVVEMSLRLAPLVRGDAKVNIIQYLTKMLASPLTIESGVAALEILGIDRANELFWELGDRSQAAIRDFLANGRYSQSKVRALYAAGEALSTILTLRAASIDKGQRSESLTNKIVKLDVEDYVPISERLSAGMRSRFFSYLGPNIVAKIINDHQRHAERTGQVAGAEAAIASLVAMHEFGAAVELDAEIERTIQVYLGQKTASGHSAYLDFYVSLGNRLEEKSGQQFIAAIESQSAVLAAEVADKVIFAATFYRLVTEQAAEIASKISVAQIAALTLAATENEWSVWQSLLSERRGEAVRDQREELKAQSASLQQQSVSKATTAIRAEIAKLRSREPLRYKPKADSAAAIEQTAAA